MAFSKLVVVALSATLFARANVPLQCKEYETQLIKTAAETLGDASFGEEAHTAIEAPNAINTLNAWTDPDWPGQNNPAPPATQEYVSPAQKELSYWKEVGALKPQPSSFLQKSNVVYYHRNAAPGNGTGLAEVKTESAQTEKAAVSDDAAPGPAAAIGTDPMPSKSGSNVETNPFPMPSKAAVNYAENQKKTDLMKAAGEVQKVRVQQGKDFKCLKDRVNAKKAVAILQDTLEACKTGVARAQSKGSETCAESCSRDFPEKECDNVYFSGCIKGCAGYGENYLNAEKTYLANSGANLAIRAKSGDTMPASIPTNEHTPDFIRSFPGGGVDQGESSN